MRLKVLILIIVIISSAMLSECQKDGDITVTDNSAATTQVQEKNKETDKTSEANEPKGDSTAANHFKVDGTKILTPDGKEFLAKGVNVNGPGWCFQRDTLQDVNLMLDVWKFNAVRLCSAMGWNWAKEYNKDLDAIIKAFTSKKIVVMLEVHDYTGAYPPDKGYWVDVDGGGVAGDPWDNYIPSAAELTAWWVDIAERFKDNPYVWFNIMNEPGSEKSKESADKWMKIHGEVIEAIRKTGAENIIVLDEHGWGQGSGYYGGKTSYDSAIIRMGPELNKKYKNIVYSLHVYDSWRDGKSRFDNYFKDAKELGLCVILGEYGVMKDNLGQHNAVKGMFDSAIPNNIGRFYWAWDDTGLPLTKSGGGGGWSIDKKDGTMPTNLTWAGEMVWLDNRGTLTAPVPDYNLNLPLLPNGDFEDGMNGWQDWGNCSVQSGESHGGKSNFMQIGSGVEGSGGSGGSGRSLDLKPNTTYTFSAWGKCNAKGSSGIDVGVKYRPGDDPENEHHVFVTFKETEWTQKSITFTMPDEFSGATLFIWKNDAKVTSWFDDLELVVGE
jgi:hypothetical protein